MNRIRTILTHAFASLTLLAATTAAFAHGATLGDLAIAHPYSLPTPPGATTGAGYIKELANRGKSDDQLVGASSPAADRVEIHTMAMDGNVMRMHPVAGVPLPAGAHVDMAPGNGYHLMLIGIKQPFRLGDRIPLTLRFEKAGTVDTELVVQERGAAMTGMPMH